MPQEEEYLRLLRQYRRLLFRRFRLIHAGELEAALSLHSWLSTLEDELRGLAGDPPSEHPHPISDFARFRNRRAISRLVEQCAFWTDRTIPALKALRHFEEEALFREKADLEIKKFLQKMFPREP